MEDGSWVRIYPIDYRLRDYSQWYKKYQWIKVDLGRHSRDKRPESYRPLGNIKVLGTPIDTRNKWAKRKQYVFKKGVKGMCWLNKQSQRDISLAIVKPRRVEDFFWEESNPNWTKRQLSALKQLRLFDNVNYKKVEKIPYKFSYLFYCEDKNCNGHKMMIEDWEVMGLYRKMRDTCSDIDSALEKVKEKFLEDICSPERDTHFFVGTTLQFGTWIIIGVWWPKK